MYNIWYITASLIQYVYAYGITYCIMASKIPNIYM